MLAAKGFIPSDAKLSRNYAHTLVFTDSQYWATTTSLLSLPNTIMGSALHDSTCIFVGLSMTMRSSCSRPYLVADICFRRKLRAHPAKLRRPLLRIQRM